MASKLLDWTGVDEKIVRDFAQDVPIAAIAREHGIAASTLRKRLVTLNVKTSSKSNKDNWSEQDIAILKTEWTKGTTGSQIGQMLGKTRNAVLGKAHRLELAQREPRNGYTKKERTSGTPKPKRVRSPPPKREMVTTGTIKKAAPIFYADRPQLTTKPPISIMELNDTTCRAPIGRGADGLVTYCGDMVFPGQVWCPGHCAIFFAPPKERRRVR